MLHIRDISFDFLHNFHWFLYLDEDAEERQNSDVDDEFKALGYSSHDEFDELNDAGQRMIGIKADIVTTIG